jgi:hypothetical protein
VILVITKSKFMRMLITPVLLIVIIQFSSCSSNTTSEINKTDLDSASTIHSKFKIDSALLIGKWQIKNIASGYYIKIDDKTISNCNSDGDVVGSPDKYYWNKGKLYQVSLGYYAEDNVARIYTVMVNKDSLVLQTPNYTEVYQRYIKKINENGSLTKTEAVLELPITIKKWEDYTVNDYEEYTVNTKSFLYDKNDVSTIRKGYLISGDVVRFVKNDGDFAYIYWESPKTHLYTYDWVLATTLNKGKSLE